MFKKSLNLTITVCFFLTTLSPLPKAHADSVLGLPTPGTMVNLSPAYEPVIIKGLTVHKDNPFLFDFIVDVGQDKMSGEPLKKEGEKLIKYFLASLAIPDKDVWVNLSPYEKNKMIPEVLGQTDMGRDLLEQDYILKQITASLIYPEKQLGKTFWDKVYSKAQEMYGTTQVPVNTFNKVWIMADRAEVFEHNQTAFVVDSHLKVMLEEDYLALQKHSVIPPLFSKEGARGSSEGIHTLSSQMVRTIILPELEKEVNTGKNFANLRQIFNSIILSSWYKKNLKEALLNQVYADRSKVKGIDLNDPTVKQQIYEQYLKAYKKGVFNYIKEDMDAAGATIPRKYFSGGMDEGMAANPSMTTDPAMLEKSLDNNKLVDFATLASTQKTGPDTAMVAERVIVKAIDKIKLDRPAYIWMLRKVLDDVIQELRAGDNVRVPMRFPYEEGVQLWRGHERLGFLKDSYAFIEHDITEQIIDAIAASTIGEGLAVHKQKERDALLGYDYLAGIGVYGDVLKNKAERQEFRRILIDLLSREAYKPDAAMRAKAGDKAGLLKSVEVYKEDDRRNPGHQGYFTGGSLGEMIQFSGENRTIEADVTPFFIPAFLRDASRSGYLLVLLDPSIIDKPLKPEIFIETRQENKELITAILKELGSKQVKSEAEEILRNSISKEEGEKKLGDFLIVKIKEIAQSLADKAMMTKQKNSSTKELDLGDWEILTREPITAEMLVKRTLTLQAIEYLMLDPENKSSQYQEDKDRAREEIEVFRDAYKSVVDGLTGENRSVAERLLYIDFLEKVAFTAYGPLRHMFQELTYAELINETRSAKKELLDFLYASKEFKALPLVQNSIPDKLIVYQEKDGTLKMSLKDEFLDKNISIEKQPRVIATYAEIIRFEQKKSRLNKWVFAASSGSVIISLPLIVMALNKYNPSQWQLDLPVFMMMGGFTGMLATYGSISDSNELRKRTSDFKSAVKPYGTMQEESFFDSKLYALASVLKVQSYYKHQAKAYITAQLWDELMSKYIPQGRNFNRIFEDLLPKVLEKVNMVYEADAAMIETLQGSVMGRFMLNALQGPAKIFHDGAGNYTLDDSFTIDKERLWNITQEADRRSGGFYVNLHWSGDYFYVQYHHTQIEIKSPGDPLIAIAEYKNDPGYLKQMTLVLSDQAVDFLEKHNWMPNLTFLKALAVYDPRIKIIIKRQSEFKDAAMISHDSISKVRNVLEALAGESVDIENLSDALRDTTGLKIRDIVEQDKGKASNKPLISTEGLLISPDDIKAVYDSPAFRIFKITLKDGTIFQIAINEAYGKKISFSLDKKFISTSRLVGDNIQRHLGEQGHLLREFRDFKIVIKGKNGTKTFSPSDFNFYPGMFTFDNQAISDAWHQSLNDTSATFEGTLKGGKKISFSLDKKFISTSLLVGDNIQRHLEEQGHVLREFRDFKIVIKDKNGTRPFSPSDFNFYSGMFTFDNQAISDAWHQSLRSDVSATFEGILKPNPAQRADRAALSNNVINTAFTRGGIDLNTSNGMQWKVSKDGNGVEMNIDPAMIERVRREGIDSLSPVIFRITPVTSIWPLVGLQAPAQAEHLAGV